MGPPTHEVDACVGAEDSINNELCLCGPTHVGALEVQSGQKKGGPHFRYTLCDTTGS